MVVLCKLAKAGHLFHQTLIKMVNYYKSRSSEKKSETATRTHQLHQKRGQPAGRADFVLAGNNDVTLLHACMHHVVTDWSRMHVVVRTTLDNLHYLSFSKNVYVVTHTLNLTTLLLPAVSASHLPECHHARVLVRAVVSLNRPQRRV